VRCRYDLVLGYIYTLHATACAREVLRELPLVSVRRDQVHLLLAPLCARVLATKGTSSYNNVHPAHKALELGSSPQAASSGKATPTEVLTAEGGPARAAGVQPATPTTRRGMLQSMRPGGRLQAGLLAPQGSALTETIDEMLAMM
jgi:hypothetical protein